VAGGILQFPVIDNEGQLSRDVDISRTGRRVVISAAGQATIDGGVYVGDDKHIRQRFVAARWSPDGRWLAYIVQTDGAEAGTLDIQQTIDDGVWVLDSATPGAKPVHVFRSTYYRASNEYPYRVPINLEWASDNEALLITVKTVGGLATVLAGRAYMQSQYFEVTPGAWLPDGSGWATTQILPGGTGHTLGIMDRLGRFTGLLNTAQEGLWMQNPVRLDNGRYAFLGKPSPNGQPDPNGLRLYLYDSGGTPVPISDTLVGEVIFAAWSPNRNALLVVLRTPYGIETKLLTLTGDIVDYTAMSSGSTATHWTP
jgi:Tol biopolymer transport system component